MSVSSLLQRAQWLDRLLPIRWRLPLRYRVQRFLGALEPELAILPQLLGTRPQALALDVGANIGIYTYALSREGARVHAFEPQPDCCDVISAWAGAGKAADRVTVHNAGVGEAAGELTLYIPLRNGRPVRTRASFEPGVEPQVAQAVQVIALDDLALPPVAFIKVDVEGHELAVLRGAARLLARDRPVLLVEIDRERQAPADFAEVIDLLAGHGYGCHAYHDGAVRSLGTTPWEAPVGIYNFIFIASPGSGASS